VVCHLAKPRLQGYAPTRNSGRSSAFTVLVVFVKKGQISATLA